MSVAVVLVLPAGSYRVSDTEVALLQQLLLPLPAQDTFNSVLKSFSALTSYQSVSPALIVAGIIYHFYRVHYFSEL